MINAEINGSVMTQIKLARIRWISLNGIPIKINRSIGFTPVKTQKVCKYIVKTYVLPKKYVGSNVLEIMLLDDFLIV